MKWSWHGRGTLDLHCLKLAFKDQLKLTCFRCQILTKLVVHGKWTCVYIVPFKSTGLLKAPQYFVGILPKDTSTRRWFEDRRTTLYQLRHGGPLFRSLVQGLLLLFCPRNKLNGTVTRYPFPLMEPHSSFNKIKNAPIVVHYVLHPLWSSCITECLLASIDGRNTVQMYTTCGMKVWY